MPQCPFLDDHYCQLTGSHCYISDYHLCLDYDDESDAIRFLEFKARLEEGKIEKISEEELYTRILKELLTRVPIDRTSGSIQADLENVKIKKI